MAVPRGNAGSLMNQSAVSIADFSCAGETAEMPERNARDSFCIT
jgi:hypothetical protein